MRAPADVTVDVIATEVGGARVDDVGDDHPLLIDLEVTLELEVAVTSGSVEGRLDIAVGGGNVKTA